MCSAIEHDPEESARQSLWPLALRLVTLEARHVTLPADPILSSFCTGRISLNIPCHVRWLGLAWHLLVESLLLLSLAARRSLPEGLVNGGILYGSRRLLQHLSLCAILLLTHCIVDANPGGCSADTWLVSVEQLHP